MELLFQTLLSPALLLWLAGQLLGTFAAHWRTRERSPYQGDLISVLALGCYLMSLIQLTVLSTEGKWELLGLQVATVVAVTFVLVMVRKRFASAQGVAQD